MALDALVRSAVALGKSLTLSLQGSVSHAAWTGQDAYGTPTYAAAVSRLALIEHRQRLRVTTSGKLVIAKAYLAFLEPIPPNGASGRTEPIDMRDKLTLPDGTTGIIVDVTGLVDSSTGRPYYSEVWLGDQGSSATVRPD